MPVTAAIAAAAVAPTRAKAPSSSRLRTTRSHSAPTRGSSSALRAVETVVVYSASEPGATGTPSTDSVAPQLSPSASPGQAAAVATAVR